MRELFTLGYTEPDALKRLDAFLARSDAKLVDIRYSPRSRWKPEFNRGALIERFGASKYYHVKELGNINYNKSGEPIKLAEPEKGVEQVIKLLQQEKAIMLLCACKNYYFCHRKTAYDLIIASLVAIGEMIWMGPDSLTPGVQVTYCGCCKRAWHQRWDIGKVDQRVRCSCSLVFCARCNMCELCCSC